ncbi:MAG TPA: glycosyltransferase [Gemmatimonadales bacterium]|nr:glycosyltransferase [Gemmatimonadales bacterium]
MASALHVVLYHHTRVPVDRYGGIERIVVWLGRALIALGHRVTLIAPPGSAIDGATLVPIDPAITHRPGGVDLRPYLPPGMDILHAHAPLARPPAVPFVWTFHGNLAPDHGFPANTIAISRDHAARHGIARWVYNGLDPAEYQFAGAKKDFDLFLGRLHSVKGWQWAVEGAQRARHPIVIAGGWRPVLRRGVRMVGKVGGAEKRALLADAACLWMPAQWDEPFGLTTIEAMVSGTPVLGTRRGALPEIVTPDAGLLGDTLDELVDLRPALAALDPEAIRARVLHHFTHHIMAARYLEVYREILSEPIGAR